VDVDDPPAGITAALAGEVVALVAGETRAFVADELVDADGVGSAGALETEAGRSGTLGPRRTPARRGQATPMTKPTTAMTPTFVHDG
jgi:uncharacterized protein (DUF3084 family)